MPAVFGDGVDRVCEQRVFVGVVLVETAAIHAGAFGDVGDRDLVEAAFAREFEQGRLQALARAGDARVHQPIMAAAGATSLCVPCEFTDSCLLSDTCRIT